MDSGSAAPDRRNTNIKIKPQNIPKTNHGGGTPTQLPDLFRKNGKPFSSRVFDLSFGYYGIANSKDLCPAKGKMLTSTFPFVLQKSKKCVKLK